MARFCGQSSNRIIVALPTRVVPQSTRGLVPNLVACIVERYRALIRVTDQDKAVPTLARAVRG